MKEKTLVEEIREKFNIIIGFVLILGIFTIVIFYRDIVSASESYAKIPVKLVKVVDGDTVKVQIDENIFPVRLIGIDCYETSHNNRSYKQAYYDKLTLDEITEKGKNSKNFLENLLKTSNQSLYLDFRGVDMYGRALGVLYFGGQNVNEKLISEGGCNVYIYKKK